MSDAFPDYYRSDDSPALSPEFYAARHEDLGHRVIPKRLRHIEGVADTAALLARTYGVDEDRARLAGLLHDWDKNYDDAEARARAESLGMVEEIGPWVVEKMPRVLHGFTASRALGAIYPQIPAEVLQAIYRHTTAAEAMTDLDKVVYIADAIEPSRRFDEAEALRGLIGEVSLDELYFRVYEYWMLALIRRRMTLHPATIDLWNSYVSQRASSKEPKRDR